MKKLLAFSDVFMQQSNWKILSLMKICLLSLGVLIGCALPKEQKNSIMLVSSVLFALSYIPLMLKMLWLFWSEKHA